MAGFAFGQADTSAQPAPSVPIQHAANIELPYTEMLTPPMPVSGVRPALRLGTEVRSNLLTGSIAVSTAYDDNMLSAPGSRVGDFSYLFYPTLDLVQTRGRWEWDLGYSPGFTLNQRLNERNQSAHDLHLLLGYRLSPHTNLQLHDTFSKTTNLFSTFLASGTDQPGPFQGPNMSPVTPLANRTANTSGLDLTYQFGRDSMVGASGGYYFVNYGAVETTSGLTSSSLIDTRSWNADAFYAHRFVGRHWLGLTYNVQRLMFDSGYRTDVQRVLLFYSLSVSSHMSFSAWAGPERSTTFLPTLALVPTDATSRTNHWNGAGGLAWSWQGTRSGFTLGYTRQTTDGGGLSEAVNMQSVSGEIRRRLTQRWTTSVGAMYATNDPVGSPSLSLMRGFHTLSGNAGFDCQVTDHLAFGIRYGRDQQKYLDAIPSVWTNRNRAWVSMSYSFSRPLGR